MPKNADRPIISSRQDVAIIGGGMIGLSLALALARFGLSSVVIDRNQADTLKSAAFDGRATAISSSSWAMLNNLDVADRLIGKTCAINRISVCEALKPGALDFGLDGQNGAADGAADAEYDEAGSDDDVGEMGVMVANADLATALLDTATNEPLISLLYGEEQLSWQVDAHDAVISLADGQTIKAGLLVGADGRNSAVRQQAGINIGQWKYGQNAVICAITHQAPHLHTAYQIFYPAGPLAVLPLPDMATGEHRSSIVWTMAQDQFAAYLNLGDRAFMAALQRQMGGFLGTVTSATPRSSYPLGYHQSAGLVANRVALVGDAAHAIHPIAGQGLNLGLRDVAALAEILGDAVRLGLDSGDTQYLGRYEDWRSLDNAMMGAVTDGINRLFAIPGAPASALRRWGMQMVGKSQAAQAFIMREAKGESGDLPKLLRPKLFRDAA